MNKPDWDAAIQAVQEARSILIVTHVKPDGDAIGSVTGLAAALRAMDKKVDAAVDGSVPDFLKYLPDTKKVKQRLKSGKWDLMISVDASDEARSGLVGQYGRKHSKKVLNLDHHSTNTMFGDIHLIVPEAVSAAEIIYDWLSMMHISISLPVATALLTGLVTDTMGFRTSNVNPRTLQLAHELMLLGAPLLEITHRTLVSKPYATIALWKSVFPSIELNNGIISALITQADLKQAELVEATDGGLVSLLIAVEEACIAVMFKELPDQRVELSLRSKVGIDVGSVAFSLGGGGHSVAAGMTLSGTLEEVKARLTPLLEKAIAQRTPAV